MDKYLDGKYLLAAPKFPSPEFTEFALENAFAYQFDGQWVVYLPMSVWTIRD